MDLSRLHLWSLELTLWGVAMTAFADPSNGDNYNYNYNDRKVLMLILLLPLQYYFFTMNDVIYRYEYGDICSRHVLPGFFCLSCSWTNMGCASQAVFESKTSSP
jgi:hypothetical protein